MKQSFQRRGAIPSQNFDLQSDRSLNREASLTGITSLSAFFAGVALGAGAMYLYDPQQGRRRRALLGDKGVHWSHKTRSQGSQLFRHLKNKTLGVKSRWMADKSHIEEVDDYTLVERVRSQFGRVVRHPGAVHATAYQGKVTLTGPILADELDELIERVEAVRGVREIENRLELHDSANNIPGLQGARPTYLQ